MKATFQSAHGPVLVSEITEYATTPEWDGSIRVAHFIAEDGQSYIAKLTDITLTH